MLCMNTYATAIVGTWVERPNVCRTDFVSMCQSLFGTEPVKNENKQIAKVNQLILYFIVTRINWTSYVTQIKKVHLTTRTTDSLFFLKQDPTSIYLL